MYDSIDINEINRINIDSIESSKKYKNILLDIRDKYRYVLSHINKAVNIPYSYIVMFYDKYLNKEDTYYIYCDSGNNSKNLCIYLTKLGYKVIDLIGGYKNYDGL